MKIKYCGALHLRPSLHHFSINILVRCTFCTKALQQSCEIFVEIQSMNSILGAEHRNIIS